MDDTGPTVLGDDDVSQQGTEYNPSSWGRLGTNQHPHHTQTGHPWVNR